MYSSSFLYTFMDCNITYRCIVPSFTCIYPRVFPSSWRVEAILLFCGGTSDTQIRSTIFSIRCTTFSYCRKISTTSNITDRNCLNFLYRDTIPPEAAHQVRAILGNCIYWLNSLWSLSHLTQIPALEKMGRLCWRNLISQFFFSLEYFMQTG